VDLLSILPFYLNFMSLDLRVLRILRLFRFLRVFKFARYNNSIKLIGEVIRDKRSELGVIMGLIIMIMIIASFIMYYAEHGVQKEAFSNVFGCFWWAIVTMTTIGYGDVFPVTYLGKIVGGVMALLGIGLVAMPTGIISAGFLEKVNEKYDKEKEEDKKHYCPYCGHKLDD
jgi:voltage-gated potassium channel